MDALRKVQADLLRRGPPAGRTVLATNSAERNSERSGSNRGLLCEILHRRYVVAAQQDS